LGRGCIARGCCCGRLLAKLMVALLQRRLLPKYLWAHLWRWLLLLLLLWEWRLLLLLLPLLLQRLLLLQLRPLRLWRQLLTVPLWVTSDSRLNRRCERAVMRLLPTAACPHKLRMCLCSSRRCGCRGDSCSVRGFMQRPLTCGFQARERACSPTAVAKHTLLEPLRPPSPPAVAFTGRYARSAIAVALPSAAASPLRRRAAGRHTHVPRPQLLHRSRMLLSSRLLLLLLLLLLMLLLLLLLLWQRRILRFRSTQC
jgi:hypothetical protein